MMSVPDEQMIADTASRRTAAVFDFDGTITRGDSYVRFLLAELRRRPARVFSAWWLPFAVVVHLLGFRSNTWLKETFLGAIVGGSDRDEIAASVAKFVPEILEHEVRPAAVRAIETHRKQGDLVVLATASLDLYVEAIAAALGVDTLVCSRVEWDGRGRVSGRLDGANCYGEAKRRAVAELFDNREDWWVVSYTDHDSDLPLLDWSDRGVAVDPGPSLRKIAVERGYAIERW